MSSDVKIAQGLRRALKARQAKLDTAVAIFEEAEPERRQKAALFLLGTHEEAEVEFTAAMNRVTQQVQGEMRAMVAGE